MIYNGTRYFYVRNAQGDVVGLTNNTGTSVVSYTYDAWGKILTVSGSKATTIGKYNPLRYRGYVYDAETGLYYLGSRYYDPGVGRFINADDVSLLGANGTFASLNLFSYCLNNPVRFEDSEGNLANWIIGGLIGGLIGGIVAAAQGKDFWEGVASGAVEGAIAGASVDAALLVVETGGVAGVLCGVGIAYVGGFGGSIAGEETESLIETGEFKPVDRQMAKRATIAGMTNVASMAFTATFNYATTGRVRGNPEHKWYKIYSSDIVSSFAATHFALHNTVKLVVD